MTAAAAQQISRVEGPDDEAYRLLSVNAVGTPDGCVGRDWFVYRILQGVNGITGYRRGTIDGVRAEAETIVAALNDRRISKKGKPNAKLKGRTTATIQLEGVK